MQAHLNDLGLKLLFDVKSTKLDKMPSDCSKYNFRDLSNLNTRADVLLDYMNEKKRAGASVEKAKAKLEKSILQEKLARDDLLNLFM